MFKNSYLAKVYRHKHFCKACKQLIVGKGTEEEPYNCSCKIWKYNHNTKKYE